MKVEIRKTLSGTEYWDNEEKRTLFVPKGEEPKDSHNPGVGIVDETDINLLGLNAEQMVDIAKENGIEVPGNMKKEETIRKYIAEKLTADSE